MDGKITFKRDPEDFNREFESLTRSFIVFVDGVPIGHVQNNPEWPSYGRWRGGAGNYDTRQNAAYGEIERAEMRAKRESRDSTGSLRRNPGNSWG